MEPVALPDSRDSGLSLNPGQRFTGAWVGVGQRRENPAVMEDNGAVSAGAGTFRHPPAKHTYARVE